MEYYSAIKNNTFESVVMRWMKLESIIRSEVSQKEKHQYSILMKNMASGPITSWEIDGETMKTVTDLTLLGSKITADGDCSHETKRRLLLGRKALQT